MNRVAGCVVAVLMAVAVVGAGRMTAEAAQGSPAAVLPPVPPSPMTPSVMVDQSRGSAGKPVKPIAVPVAPASAATTTVPVAVAAPLGATAAPIAATTAEPQAPVEIQKTESAAAPVKTASYAPLVNAAVESKPLSAEHPDAVPIWAPDLPPHVAAQRASAVTPKAASGTRPIYATIPQNAPAAVTPASALPAAPAAVAQPVTSPAASSQAVAAPVKAAAPTAIAAILPPSAAHPDYLQTGGMTNGVRMFEEDNYGAVRDPANWLVRIFKHSHRLKVYYRDNLYKSYHAVFGRSQWPGAKEVENDRRTPEGDYMIVQKHPSRRFDWFLKINYPNAKDREHFEELRDEGKIPLWEREGGQVGIHGTDNPLLNVDDVNWTTGCISIDNDDISELARLLPIGTVVIIKP